MPNTKLLVKNLLDDFDLERLTHSLKTALACLLGYFFTRITALHIDQWLIITIIVVMCAQINVGSVINKAAMRFLGTLSGSILAILTLAMFGANPIAIAAVICVSAIIFSYIATGNSSYSDSGTLGAVTVIIILLSADPTIHVATHRFFEISFGILIAAFFSQFILPIHARSHLRLMQAKTMRLLRDYYRAALIEPVSEESIQDYTELDEEIVKALSSQRTLAKQSKRENFHSTFNHDKFNKILRCDKEIFRSVVCMRYACDMLPSGRKSLSNLTAIKNFHQAMCQTFDKIAPALEQKKFAGNTIDIPSLQAVKETIQAAIKVAASEDVVYLNGFLFCAELMVVHLTELVILLEKHK